MTARKIIRGKYIIMKQANKKKKIVNRILNKKGFSFSELLISTLIMVLATGVLASTISLASNHYEKQITKSKANILCDSLSFVMRERLSSVYKCYSGGVGSYSYYGTSQNLQNYPFTVEKNENGELVFQYYEEPDGTGGDEVVKLPLVGSGSYFEGSLRADFEVAPISAGSEAARDEENTDNTNKKISYFSVKLWINDKDSAGEDNAIVKSEFLVYPFSGDIPLIEK